MRKIPTIFVRDMSGDPSRVLNEAHPDAAWVFAGEGVATRKLDGTACMIRDGLIFKRYDAKRATTPPDGFVPAQEADEKTGHWPGWLVCLREDRADCWHFEAFDRMIRSGEHLRDGTYELVGPKVQGNPEGAQYHHLVAHDSPGLVMFDVPRDFEGLRAFFQELDMEGIVWHHPDGRMAKIKARDFGIKWPKRG